MSKGLNVVVTSPPGGVNGECTVVGTPKPGICMDLIRPNAATDIIGGRFKYEPYGTTAASGVQGVAADGNRCQIAVLNVDWLQGRTYTDAYVTLTRGFLYFPRMGEELNMWVQNQSGTADDFVIGDKLIVDDGTGQLLISASTPESEPFICLEIITDPTADTFTHVLYTGY